MIVNSLGNVNYKKKPFVSVKILSSLKLQCNLSERLETNL